MTFASFQDFRKWDNRRQWLSKCVKCTNGLLRRCLRHSFRMPSIPEAFLNFKELITSVSHTNLFSRGGGVVYGFEQNCNSNLHPPFMVFVTQVMVCELIFQTVSNCVAFLGRMKFKAWRTMNSSLCPFSILVKEGFRNGPNSLRCDFRVTYFCFPSFKCLLRVIRLIYFMAHP
jgi:hypothetical protein